MMKSLKKIFKKFSEDDHLSTSYADELIDLASRRAENYFKEHGLSCSEASLLVVNRSLGGGLTAEQALCLGSGFGGGVGGSGSLCGALSGAVMALGLFLGPGSENGLGKRKFRKLVADFHDSFSEESGSVCCRDLIADFRKDRKGKIRFCCGLTGRCTGETVRIILMKRPELAGIADMEFLRGHDSAIAVVLQKIFGSKADNGNMQ